MTDSETMEIFDTEIAQWKNCAQAALTFSFDGGYRETYNSAITTLLKNKMVGTFYLVTDYVGRILEGFPVADWSAWRRAALLGMEIASHTVTHPKFGARFTDQIFEFITPFHKLSETVRSPRKILTLKKELRNRITQTRIRKTDYETMKKEIVHSKRVIDEQIPSQKTLSFAYPHGLYSYRLKKIVKNAGYISARSTDPGYNLPRSLDFYVLKGNLWDESTDVETANGWVDENMEKGAWLIEVHHIIGKNKPQYHFYTRLSDFNQHVSYVASRNVWVDTQQNIIKYLIERNSTKANPILRNSGRLILSVENSLDHTIYDQALTMKTCVPSTWAKVKVSRETTAEILSTFKRNGQQYIYYDVRPAEKKVVITPL